MNLGWAMPPTGSALDPPQLRAEIARMANVEYRGMNLVIPENDSEWREHFKLARPAAEARPAQVAKCGLMRYPPSHGCPWCPSLEWSWQEVSGAATSTPTRWCITPSSPDSREWTPYTVALVELDEQRGAPTPDEALRIIANVVTRGIPPGARGQYRHRQAGSRGLPGHRRRLGPAPGELDRGAAGGPGGASSASATAKGAGAEGPAGLPRVSRATMASNALSASARTSSRVSVWMGCGTITVS